MEERGIMPHRGFEMTKRRHATEVSDFARICRKVAEFRPEDIDIDEKTIKAVITTQVVDRDMEVVLTAGLDLSAIDPSQGGPGPVLFMHDPYSVIGKTVWVKRGRNKIVAMTKFADTPLANEVFSLYAGGFMRGWSIGMDWMTIKRRRPEDDEIKKNPAWAKAEAIIETADVYEYSAVSIASNREALNKSWNAGMIKTTEPYFDSILSGVVEVVDTGYDIVVEV